MYHMLVDRKLGNLKHDESPVLRRNKQSLSCATLGRNVCVSMCYFLIDHSLKTRIHSLERHVHTLIHTMYKMDKTEISSGQIWHVNIRLYTENILRSPHRCAIIYRGN